MPRSVKESSDDESEIKSGRRSKILSGNAVDSPLRRSTRNKPTISPPEAAGDTSDASTVSNSAQVGRTTRRRTTTTIPEAEGTQPTVTRSLRSRKISTTSTTSLDSLSVEPVVMMTDCEILKDATRTRVARQSTPVADTPPTTRLRRQVRAGSESKTMSPSRSVRVTRRTRASSVDLDEQRDEVKPIACNINDSNQLSTPVKTRRRASVVPSEPAVLEEVEKVSQSTDTELSHTSPKKIESNEVTQPLSPVTENESVIQQDQEVQLNTSQHIEEPGNNSEEIQLNTSQHIEEPENNNEDTKVNISLSSPKVSAVINSSISLKSPVIETKNTSFVEKMNDSLEQSPGNKENVKPLSFTNSIDNCESATSDFKLTINESLTDKMLTPTKNLLNKSSEVAAVTTPVVISNVSINVETVDMTDEKHNLSDCQQNQSISESVDKLDGSSINLLAESTEDENVKNSEEEIEAPETLSMSTETPMDVVEESTGKDNIETPASPLLNNEDDVNETSGDKSILAPSADLEESSMKLTVDEDDADVENLFQDIPAEEWKADTNTEIIKSDVTKELTIPEIKVNDCEPDMPEESTETDNNNDKAHDLDNDNKNKSIDSDNNNQDNITQLRDIECDSDSNDTIIVAPCDNQSQKLYSENGDKLSEIQEAMEVDEDDNDTEIDPDLEERNQNVSLLGSSKKKQERLSNGAEISKNMSFSNTSHNDDNESNKEDKLDNSLLASPLVEKNNSINLSENNCSPNRTKGNDSMKAEELSTSASSMLLGNKQNSINNKNLLRKSVDSAKFVMTNEENEKCNIKKKLNASISSGTTQMNVSATEKKNTSGIGNLLSPNKSVMNYNNEKLSTPKSDKKKDINSDSVKSTRSRIMNLVDPDTDEDDKEEDKDDDEVDKSKRNSISKVSAPSLLLTGASSSSDDEDLSDTDSSLENSDIAREYNLNGDEVTEYSDDNVVGDECRESESEYSDDDDDGEDLADFIADDEDIEEEEEEDDDESAGESGDDDEKEDAMSMSSLSEIDAAVTEDQEGNEVEEESEDDDDSDEDEKDSGDEGNEETLSQTEVVEDLEDVDEEGEDEEEEDEEEEEEEEENQEEMETNGDSDDEEENYKHGLKKVQKLIKFDSHNTFNDHDNEEEDDTSLSTSLRKILNNSSKLPAHAILKRLNESLNSKTKSCSSTPINSKFESRGSKSADSKVEKRRSKLMVDDKASSEITPGKLSKKSKSLSTPHHNKSLELANVTDHDEVLLMKEKLNETLPIIKLQLNDSKLSSKGRSKLNESNKENAVEIKEEISVLKGKKNKKRDAKIATSQLEESIDKSKAKKVCSLETDSKAVKSKNKSKKNKTVELDNDETEITSKKLKKKKNKEKKENLLNVADTSFESSASTSLKRLPDEIIEELSDAHPKKKRKLSAVAYGINLPSRKMFDVNNPVPENMIVETVREFRPSMNSGGTTAFSVVNLNKITKRPPKKSAAAFSFRQRILGRNPRQPISAYVMYQQKIKASGKDKN